MVYAIDAKSCIFPFSHKDNISKNSPIYLPQSDYCTFGFCYGIDGNRTHIPGIRLFPNIKRPPEMLKNSVF